MSQLSPTYYRPLSLPMPEWNEPVDPWARSEEMIQRAPLPITILIGLFAASNFVVGDNLIFYRITYYLGITCAILVAINYLRMSLPIPTPVYLYAAWVAWASIGCLLAEFREVAFTPLLTGVQLLVMLFAFGTMCQDTRAVWLVSWLTVLGALANFLATAASGWSMNERAEGLLHNPNSTGLAYGVAICILWVALASTRFAAIRVIILALLAALHYGLIMTGSRGGALAIGAVTIYMIWYWRRRIAARPSAIALVIVTLLGGITLLPNWISKTSLGSRMVTAVSSVKGQSGGDGSAAERIQLKVNGLTAFSESPFFGLGLSNFWPYGIKTGRWNQTTHDNYMAMLSETGLPGFCLFYSIYIWIWVQLGRLAKSEWITPQEHDVTTLGRMFIVLLACHDLFSDTTWTNKTVWAMVAIIAGFVPGLKSRIAIRSATAAESQA